MSDTPSDPRDERGPVVDVLRLALRQAETYLAGLDTRTLADHGAGALATIRELAAMHSAARGG